MIQVSLLEKYPGDLVEKKVSLWSLLKVACYGILVVYQIPLLKGIFVEYHSDISCTFLEKHIGDTSSILVEKVFEW